LAGRVLSSASSSLVSPSSPLLQPLLVSRFPPPHPRHTVPARAPARPRARARTSCPRRTKRPVPARQLPHTARRAAASSTLFRARARSRSRRAGAWRRRPLSATARKRQRAVRVKTPIARLAKHTRLVALHTTTSPVTYQSPIKRATIASSNCSLSSSLLFLSPPSSSEAHPQRDAATTNRHAAMPTTRKEAGAAGAGGPAAAEATAASGTPQAAGGAGADISLVKEVVEAPPEPTRVKNLYDSADLKHQLDSVAVEVRGEAL